MAFLDAAGNNLTETELRAKLTEVSSETVYSANEKIYQSFTQDGGGFEKGRKLFLDTGSKITESEVDGLFVAGDITSITPATGLAAGGTAVTIRGTNFSGAEGVTFGGTAATSFKVVDNTTITCVTPAKAAGTYNVVVADDAGNITETNGFVYT